MYSVLLVDDERIITEGMSKVIDWESIGTTLIGTARNGIEAFQFIEEKKPDIVISDIKMPGMNGLELVSKVYKLYPDTKFILLSGFGEFEYAKQAMECGVKHYLLKPCNENAIAKALQEVCAELDQQKVRLQLVENMKKTIETVLPYAKESFLKEAVTNGLKEEDLSYYQNLFQMDLQHVTVRLVLLQIKGVLGNEQVNGMKKMIEKILKTNVFCCVIEKFILVLIEDRFAYNDLQQLMKRVKEAFFQKYGTDCSIVISDPGKIKDVNQLYKQAAFLFDNRHKNKYSAVIKKVLDIIDENLGDQHLTLQWVAKEMLYMNADYLGKLFKKEVGEKFSNYLTRIRIEKAIEMIEKEKDLKIFELAEKVGFGNNPQYFGQVFKKYTGMTPSEYKKAVDEKMK